jgi:hypothetical protein
MLPREMRMPPARHTLEARHDVDSFVIEIISSTMTSPRFTQLRKTI